MTITDTIEAHQARCLPHLRTLRTIAGAEAGLALTRLAVLEIALATRAVLAEAETAAGDARDAVGIGAGGPGTAVLVRVRLNRLAAAAEDVIAAAGSGDCGQMRSHLHRFDALTAAIWTVQRAVYGAGGQGPSGI
jgi:hypothetical protein